MKSFKSSVFIFFLLIVFIYSSKAAANRIPDPESVIGFKLGSDYKLANWDQISKYFKILSQTSDKIQVLNLGKTEMDNDFLLAIISSPETLKNLQKYRDIQNKIRYAKISDGAELQGLVKEGKTVILLSCSMHSDETGASQMAPLLAYELVTSQSDVVKQILDNVIILMLPCTNPDGLEMIADYYMSLNPGPGVEIPEFPRLYNKYVGHDNNRDFYMFTQKGHKLIAKILYEQWFPEVVFDMHQKGVHFEDCRIFVPPFSDPVFPILNPIGIRQQELIGGYMSTDLTAGGYPWVQDHYKFTLWWQGGLRVASAFHNMTCILTEAASCDLASPIFPTPQQLQTAKENPPENPTVDYPQKWRADRPWRLADIVQQDKIAAMAVLKAIARNKDMIKTNFYKMNKESIEKGKTEKPFAYVIPADQHDIGAMTYFVEVMLRQDTSFEIATEEFTANGKTYPSGSIILYLAQPSRTNILSLMENYEFVKDLRPYDITGWTLPLQMGIEYRRIDTPFTATTKPYEKAVSSTKFIADLNPKTYYISANSIDHYRAANELLDQNFSLSMLTKPYKTNGQTLPAGSIAIAADPGLTEKIINLSQQLSLTVIAAEKKDSSKSKPITKSRVAIINEPNSTSAGWLRWTLENHKFDYTSIDSNDFNFENLNQKFDCILIVDSPTGQNCDVQIQQFVKNGGTVVAWSKMVLETAKILNLNITQVPDANDEEKFGCPGSILKMNVTTDHPITYGMQKETFVVFRNQEVVNAKKCKILGRYPKANPLISGWLMGPELIEDTPGIIYKTIGKGKVVLIGFEPVFRAQTLGTFKLVFNAIFNSTTPKSGWLEE